MDQKYIERQIELDLRCAYECLCRAYGLNIRSKTSEAANELSATLLKAMGAVDQATRTNNNRVIIDDPQDRKVPVHQALRDRIREANGL